jgi:hypothetical protein
MDSGRLSRISSHAFARSSPIVLGFVDITYVVVKQSRSKVQTRCLNDLLTSL